MFKHVPNILTMIRFALIPFIIIFGQADNYIAVIIVYTLSAITDVLDGTIARKYNLITDFRKIS